MSSAEQSLQSQISFYFVIVLWLEGGGAVPVKYKLIAFTLAFITFYVAGLV